MDKARSNGVGMEEAGSEIGQTHLMAQGGELPRTFAGREKKRKDRRGNRRWRWDTDLVGDEDGKLKQHPRVCV